MTRSALAASVIVNALLWAVLMIGVVRLVEWWR
jgi:hypothetical protein